MANEIPTRDMAEFTEDEHRKLDGRCRDSTVRSAAHKRHKAVTEAIKLAEGVTHE
jgi:hypothetical protein